MTQGVYVGAIRCLRHKTALLQEGSTPGKVKAQFDETEGPAAKYSHGWHTFHKEEFRILPEEEG